MAIQIVKAERKKAKMRIGVSSASWQWKTYSSLLMAKWLANWDLSKVCLIDTENWSGHLYSHLWEYSVIEIDPVDASTSNILEAFKAAEDNGFEVIIWDSSSHRWDWILSKNDEAAKRMYNNSFRAWAETTPLYNRVVNHMLASPCHVIVTSRKKQEYALEKSESWKTEVKKLWMKDVQRDTFEYELTTVFNLDSMHYATVSKDRTELFDWQEPFIITEETWKQMREWCESWAEVKVQPKPKVEEKPAEPVIEKADEEKVEEPKLPPIENERFMKACEKISSWEATIKSLVEHFTLTQDQKDILKELFKDKKD